MNKKGFKIALLVIAITGLAYAGFRFAETLTGTIRLKYSVIKMQEFKEAPEETPLEE